MRVVGRPSSGAVGACVFRCLLNWSSLILLGGGAALPDACRFSLQIAGAFASLVQLVCAFGFCLLGKALLHWCRIAKLNCRIWRFLAKASPE